MMTSRALTLRTDKWESQGHGASLARIRVPQGRVDRKGPPSTESCGTAGCYAMWGDSLAGVSEGRPALGGPTTQRPTVTQQEESGSFKKPGSSRPPPKARGASHRPGL